MVDCCGPCHNGITVRPVALTDFQDRLGLDCPDRKIVRRPVLRWRARRPGMVEAGKAGGRSVKVSPTPWSWLPRTNEVSNLRIEFVARTKPLVVVSIKELQTVPPPPPELQGNVKSIQRSTPETSRRKAVDAPPVKRSWKSAHVSQIGSSSPLYTCPEPVFKSPHSAHAWPRIDASSPAATHPSMVAASTGKSPLGGKGIGRIGFWRRTLAASNSRHNRHKSCHCSGGKAEGSELRHSFVLPYGWKPFPIHELYSARSAAAQG